MIVCSAAVAFFLSSCILIHASAVTDFHSISPQPCNLETLEPQYRNNSQDVVLISLSSVAILPVLVIVLMPYAKQPLHPQRT